MPWDFHCHADLYGDAAALQRDVRQAGLTVMAVTTTPRAYAGNQSRFGGNASFKIALGLHPELAGTREADLELFQRLSSGVRYIGEIGLDARPQSYRTLPRQRDVFRFILSLCRGKDKIISIHSARAAKLVLDDIEQTCSDLKTKKILHWFSGSKSESRRASALGCYFSVNLSMLRLPIGRELAKALPRERILLETDGPLTSVSERPAFPSDILTTAEALSELWGRSSQWTRRHIEENEALLNAQ